jgi:hypothetical protein
MPHIKGLEIIGKIKDACKALSAKYPYFVLLSGEAHN